MRFPIPQKQQAPGSRHCPFRVSYFHKVVLPLFLTLKQEPVAEYLVVLAVVREILDRERATDKVQGLEGYPCGVNRTALPAVVRGTIVGREFLKFRKGIAAQL